MALVGNKVDLEEKRQVGTQVKMQFRLSVSLYLKTKFRNFCRASPKFSSSLLIENAGGDGIRRAKRPLLHRDLGQDVAERHRALLRTRQALPKQLCRIQLSDASSPDNNIYVLLPADRLVKVRPYRPSGMVLHDGRRRRDDGGGWPWRLCCSG